MSKHNVVALSGREKIRDELTELIRDGIANLTSASCRDSAPFSINQP